MKRSDISCFVVGQQSSLRVLLCALLLISHFVLPVLHISSSHVALAHVDDHVHGKLTLTAESGHAEAECQVCQTIRISSHIIDAPSQSGAVLQGCCESVPPTVAVVCVIPFEVVSPRGPPMSV